MHMGTAGDGTALGDLPIKGGITGIRKPDNQLAGATQTDNDVFLRGI
jgi:hypothetical protein